MRHKNRSAVGFRCASNHFPEVVIFRARAYFKRCLNRLLWTFVQVVILFLSAGILRAASSEPSPRRIVSLTLGTDEILLSLVDPGRIVAVTYLATDPGISNVAEVAKAIPNKIRADTEQVVALEPDLVLVASYTSADVVKQLVEAGLPVVKLSLFSSIEGIKQNILTVGRAVGELKKAEEMVAEMDRRLQKIADRVSVVPVRPGVFFFSQSGFTAGRETTFDDRVRYAGGRNLAAEAGVMGHPKISLETLILLDPERILISDWNPQQPNFHQELLGHPALKGLSALRNNQVYSVPGRHLTTVSQYIVDGVEEIARVIHPELFLKERRGFRSSLQPLPGGRNLSLKPTLSEVDR